MLTGAAASGLAPKKPNTLALPVLAAGASALAGAGGLGLSTWAQQGGGRRLCTGPCVQRDRGDSMVLTSEPYRTLDTAA